MAEDQSTQPRFLMFIADTGHTLDQSIENFSAVVADENIGI